MTFIHELKRRLNFENEPLNKRQKQDNGQTSEINTIGQVCEIILEELKNESIDLIILECYKNVCRNGQVQIYFKKNIDLFKDILLALLGLILRNMKEKNDKFILSSLQCLNENLDFILEMYRMPSTQIKTENIFLSDLIYPLCIVAENKVFDINTKLNLCIKKIIFNKINKPKLKDQNEIRNVLFFINLVKKISKLDSDSIRTCFSKIIEIAKETNDFILIDYIFRNLISCLTNNKTKSVGICTLLTCLKNVTIDLENQIQDVSLMSFLESIVDEILLKNDLVMSDYEILKEIVNINALILENKNESLLLKILTIDNLQDTNHNIQNNIMQLLLEVCVLLKRETKFVFWLLNTVKLSSEKNCHLQIHVFSEPQFLKGFTKTICHIGYKQSFNILKTLMYFLKVDVVEKLSNATNGSVFIMLQIITELSIAYFNGVTLQNHMRSEVSAEKFLQTMMELKIILSNLLDSVLETPNNEIMNNCLIRVIHYWERFTWILIQHYDCGTITNQMQFSLDNNKMQIFLNKINKSDKYETIKEMYRYLFFQIKSKKSKEESVNYDILLSDISKYSSILLHEYSDLVKEEFQSQTYYLSSEFIVNILKNGKEIENWKNNFKNDVFDSNLQFTLALVCHIFNYIKSVIECESIQAIFIELDFKLIFDQTCNESLLSESVLELKKKITDIEWKQMNVKDTLNIQKILNILQDLRIEFLPLNIKRLIFMLLYSFCQSCETNKNVLNSCRLIFLDLLHDCESCFSKCVHPLFFVNDSLQPYKYKVLFAKMLEKKKFIKSMENFMTSESFQVSCASTLLRCIENTIPDCLNEKVEAKLKKLRAVVCDSILEHAHMPTTETCVVKALTLALQEKSLDGKIDDLFGKCIHDNLNHLVNMHLKKELEAGQEWSLLSITQELAIEALKNSICIDIKSNIINFLYDSDIKTKVKISRLFKMFEKDNFVEFYNLLNKRLIVACQTIDEKLLLNYISNWIDIIHAGVGSHHDLRIKNLTNDLTILLTMRIDDKLLDEVIRFINVVITNTKLVINGTIVDICIMIHENSLRQCKANYCLHTLKFCSDLFMHRPELAADRSSLILDMFQNSVKYVIKESRATGDQNRSKLMVTLNAMEKVSITFNKSKKEIGRSHLYVISNLIKWYSAGFVLPYVKESLQICIGAILSTCNQYSIAFLRRCLPVAEQKIFDSFYQTYKKHYKFTGKI